MVGLGSILLILCVKKHGLKNKKYPLDEKLKGSVNTEEDYGISKNCMALKMSEHN